MLPLPIDAQAMDAQAMGVWAEALSAPIGFRLRNAEAGGQARSQRGN
jgi:hypothetical protein